MTTRYWLMKSEPESFSIDDLRRVKVEPWTGVRSYFARLQLRAMTVGDLALFHHSNASPPGAAGVARVVRTNVIDETQFDPKSPYHDPKATRDAPVWDCVEVEYVETFPYYVAMDRLRAEPALAEMAVLKRGMRLSVQPVTPHEYACVVELGHTPPVAATGRPRVKTPPAVRIGRPTKPIPAKPAKPAPAKAAKRATPKRATPPRGTKRR